MVYEFLADGFEIAEAMFPIDILRRADIEITTVGIDSDKVVSSCGVEIKADMKGKKFQLPSDAEMVILPGGMPGTTNLLKSETVKKALSEVKKRNIYAAAICAAPWVLDEAGLLDGKKATMYPTMKEHMKKGTFTGSPVEIDGKIITARGAGVAQEFGLALAEALRGRDAALKVKNSIYPNF